MQNQQTPVGAVFKPEPLVYSGAGSETKARWTQSFHTTSKEFAQD